MAVAGLIGLAASDRRTSGRRPRAGSEAEIAGPSVLRSHLDMPNFESRYVPVIQLVAGVAVARPMSLLTESSIGLWWSLVLFGFATMGAISVFRDGWRLFHLLRFKIAVKKAYQFVAYVHKPEILEVMEERARLRHRGIVREEAQKAVDDVMRLLDVFGMERPNKIDVNDEKSVEDWHEYLRSARRKEY